MLTLNADEHPLIKPTTTKTKKTVWQPSCLKIVTMLGSKPKPVKAWTLSNPIWRNYWWPELRSSCLVMSEQLRLYLRINLSVEEPNPKYNYPNSTLQSGHTRLERNSSQFSADMAQPNSVFPIGGYCVRPPKRLLNSHQPGDFFDTEAVGTWQSAASL